MPHHLHPAKCYVDDKDFYDLLMSSNVPTKALVDILHGRGLFYGTDGNEDDEDIMEWLSTQRFDWVEFRRIAESLDRTDRQERSGHREIVCNAESGLSISRLTQVAKELEGARAASFSEKYQITAHETGSVVEIKVEYVEPDLGATRVLQHRVRDAIITLQLSGNSVQVEHTDSDKTLAILEDFTKRLEDKVSGEIGVTEVDISSIRSPSARTGFFETMIKGLRDATVHDVTSIKICRKASFDLPDDEVELDEDEIEAAEKRIRKAMLSGGGALDSEEFARLKELGYFVTSATWQCDDTAGDRPRVEMLAEFHHGADGRRFRIAVLGIWERDDEGDIKKSKRRPTRAEGEDYRARLREAAIASKSQHEGNVADSDMRTPSAVNLTQATTSDNQSRLGAP